MRLALLCCCLLISACGAAPDQPLGQESRPRFEELVREFDYDAKAPLDVREVGRERKDGVTVVDLTYSSPRGGRVPAYLVVPDGGGPFAAILFGHWMMPGSTLANRREFLDEAVVLAHAGAVSLLIDAPLVRPGFVRETADEIREQIQGTEAARQQVIDFRRGTDLLVARPDVDPRRIAYVGHSFDAHVGGILTGVEKRINSFVLMAGGFSDEEYLFDPENPAMLEVRKRIGDEKLRAFLHQYAYGDAAHFVGHSAPAAVFLQFGRQDKPLPEKWARRFYELFAEPKKLGLYDAGHALDKAARVERARWLAQRLSLKKLDEAALNRIPDLK
ncbi:MAG TPA: hypothetical protein VJT74_03380 [Pyrinomonadaceae bacterium]|nr:hypothetical protein [Pyrinomonadaceae bacterium]